MGGRPCETGSQRPVWWTRLRDIEARAVHLLQSIIPFRRAPPWPHSLQWPVALPPSSLCAGRPCAPLLRLGRLQRRGDVSGRVALAFVLLISRSCATGTGFRLVPALMAFGGLACSGLRRGWLLFSVPLGLCSCTASSASAVSHNQIKISFSESRS
jgi:hypothetical protein